MITSRTTDPPAEPEAVLAAHDPRQDQLQARLEADYEFHTERLARLTTGDGHAAVRAAAVAASAASATAAVATSRRALADIAAALRDMAEGRYGRCEDCNRPIPVERLQARPELRLCVRCLAEHPAPGRVVA